MKITTPDQITSQIKTPTISRLIHNSFYQHIIKALEITILYGPRQVGKSQELFTCISQLLKDRHSDIFYYNLDFTPEEFENPEAFTAFILAQKDNPGEQTYVFLDEAQRLENIGLFVKYIYDQNKKIKFILTGSASLDIKAKIKEPLTGRKKEFYLAPLTLQEIIKFRGVKKDRIISSFPLLGKILDDFLLFGGYPEVVAIDSKSLKIDKLEEITQTYTLKDISAFFNFENPRTLQIVARFLAENIGNILSLENISKIAGIPKYQTQKAIDALEKSFIIKLIPPFYKSPSKELTHRPKVFFQDTGLRNALLNKLDSSLINSDKGQLFENAMATELQNLYSADRLKFWRTTNQTEVDFVISRPDGKIHAIEAKYQWETRSKKKKGALPKNLQSFKNQYPDIIESVSVVSKSNYWKLF